MELRLQIFKTKEENLQLLKLASQLRFPPSSVFSRKRQRVSLLAFSKPAEGWWAIRNDGTFNSDFWQLLHGAVKALLVRVPVLSVAY